MNETKPIRFSFTVRRRRTYDETREIIGKCQRAALAPTEWIGWHGEPIPPDTVGTITVPITLIGPGAASCHPGEWHVTIR